jgi:CRP/FNR family transcriptional regulator, cyclic AMP receptor protein
MIFEMDIMESTKQDVRKMLASLELTEGMPDSAIDQLAAIAQLNAYPAGRVLFYESDRHDHLHVLCDGLVTMEMRVPGHGIQKILTLGRGELLAWSALLSDGVMTTSAIVTEDTTLIELPTERLKTLCEQNHELGYYVMRQVAISLARRLVATRLQLLDLFADGGR